MMNQFLAPGRILRSISACECIHLELASKQIADDISKTGQLRSDALPQDECKAVLVPADADHLSAPSISSSEQAKITLARRTLLNLSKLINMASSMPKDERAIRHGHSQNAADTIIQSFMLKATQHSTSSKLSFCIWKGDRARKYLFVLRWIFCRYSDVIIGFSIRIFNKADDMESEPNCKEIKMATSLVLFELFQSTMSTRDAVVEWNQTQQPEGSITRQDQLETYLLLLGTLEKSVVGISATQRTRLDMARYEAFIATSCFIAVYLSHTKLNDMRPYYVLADLIAIILDKVEEWQKHRFHPCNPFLSYAVHQFRCRFREYRKLFGMQQKELQQAGIEMMLYTWTKSAMLFCTRSDATLKLRTNVMDYRRSKLPSNTNDMASTRIRHIIIKLEQMICGHKSQDTMTNEITLRNMCLVLGLLPKAEVTRAFPRIKITMETHLMTLAKTLRSLTWVGHDRNEALVLSILRLCLCSSIEENTNRSRALYQGYADVLILHMMRTVSRSRARLEAKFFENDFIQLGEFILRSCVRIYVLLDSLQSNQPVLVEASLGIVRAILKSQDRAGECESNRAIYREQLTPPILHILASTNMSSLRDQVTDLLEWLNHTYIMKSVIDYLINGSPPAIRRGLGLLSHFVSVVLVTESHFEEQFTRLFARLRHALNLIDQVSEPLFVTSPSDWMNVSRYRSEKALDAEEVRNKKQTQMVTAIRNVYQVITPCRCRIMIQVLLRQMMNSPRDGVHIKMLRDALEHVSNLDSPGKNGVVNQVFQNLANSVLLKLKDLDHLEKMQNTTKVSYQAEALVFARLCPFVALRVVPEKMFWFPSCSDERSLSHDCVDSLTKTGEDVRHAVYERMIATLKDANSSKEINMLSIEILLKFHVEYGFERIARELEAFLDSVNITDDKGEYTWWSHRTNGSRVSTDNSSCQLTMAKSLVYYLNRLAQREGSAIFQRHITCSDYIVSRIVILLLGITSIPVPFNAKGLTCVTSFDHIREGCVCCLAALIQQCLEVTSASVSSLVELTLSEVMVLLASYGYPKVENWRKVSLPATGTLVDQLGVLKRHPLPIQARICCCKALLHAVEHAKQQNLTPIFQIVVQGLLNTLETSNQDPTLEDMMLQVLQAALSKAHPDFDISDLELRIRKLTPSFLKKNK